MSRLLLGLIGIGLGAIIGITLVWLFIHLWPLLIGGFIVWLLYKYVKAWNTPGEGE
jgi:uncharacterized membrane protein YccC